WNDFTVAMVTFLCHRARQAGLLAPVSQPEGDKRLATTTLEAGLPHCWSGRQLAKHLDLPATTLNTWRRRGWIHACRWAGQWLYWANDEEIERLMALRNQPRSVPTRVPSNLKTPLGQPSWPVKRGENETSSQKPGNSSDP